MKRLEGYRGFILERLRKINVEIGDEIVIEKNNEIIEGILMPRSMLGDDKHVVIKLRNGYNVGVKIESETIIRLKKKRKIKVERKIESIKKKALPKIAIIGTGGTIASRVDYKTGAVYPALTPEDLYAFVPEIEGIATIDTETLFNIFSEDMTPQHWTRIAEKIAEKIEEEYKGIIIPHGTDTMAYTAAALSFALQRTPIPIVLVGAQRSSDRPSSDAAINLICSTHVAVKAPFAEVVVVMHGSSSDEYCLVHRGTKVRKCHTSRRDAFQSINAKPLAIVKPNGKIEMLMEKYSPRREDREYELKAKFDSKVALLKMYPGIREDLIETLIDRGYHGIVIEGTGLGHAPSRLLKTIRRAIEEEIPIVMTSQCIWGRINMNVYRTGVELLNAGVIPGEDMLPETATVKLMWILAQTRDLKEVRELMLTNIAGEINPRTTHGTYLKSWIR
ncbi:MAG: Glu-tRNA(Gln) amidotransferase subunit GatD [archaeon GB-1845-036]|nr:Glu-tRNA(Gln) amidotransferase subunit GatD [Candidatus Culexmicrobium thermophilum]